MHYKRSLNFPNSYALLSADPEAETAVFFVHGFNGSAVGTWLNFQNLVDENTEYAAWWAKCDLYFYQYPTISWNVSVQASRLTEFIKAYFPTPSNGALSSPSSSLIYLLGHESVTPLPLTQTYRRLVLVGHSLGGVIIRQAIADEVLNLEGRLENFYNRTDLESTCLFASLRLFAPAIFGFEPSNFGGLCYYLITEQPFLNRFLKPALRANPLHRDLEAGSQRLLDLRRRTEAFAVKYPKLLGLRAHLIFGDRENVVYMDRFDCDPVYKIIPNQDHQSICKPNTQYITPLEFISDGVFRTASVR